MYGQRNINKTPIAEIRNLKIFRGPLGVSVVCPYCSFYRAWTRFEGDGRKTQHGWYARKEVWAHIKERHPEMIGGS